MARALAPRVLVLPAAVIVAVFVVAFTTETPQVELRESYAERVLDRSRLEIATSHVLRSEAKLNRAEAHAQLVGIRLSHLKHDEAVLQAKRASVLREQRVDQEEELKHLDLANRLKEQANNDVIQGKQDRRRANQNLLAEKRNAAQLRRVIRDAKARLSQPADVAHTQRPLAYHPPSHHTASKSHLSHVPKRVRSKSLPVERVLVRELPAFLHAKGSDPSLVRKQAHELQRVLSRLGEKVVGDKQVHSRANTKRKAPLPKAVGTPAENLLSAEVWGLRNEEALLRRKTAVLAAQLAVDRAKDEVKASQASLKSKVAALRQLSGQPAAKAVKAAEAERAQAAKDAAASQSDLQE